MPFLRKSSVYIKATGEFEILHGQPGTAVPTVRPAIFAMDSDMDVGDLHNISFSHLAVALFIIAKNRRKSTVADWSKCRVFAVNRKRIVSSKKISLFAIKIMEKIYEKSTNRA